MKYTCAGCFEEKEFKDFHKNSQAKRGFAYSCKACENARSKTKHQKNIDEIRLKQKLHARERLKNNPDYRKNLYEKNKDKIMEYQKKVREKNKDKINARCKLNLWVLRGHIQKPDICSICQERPEKIEAHHENYSDALNVIWVCKKCHTILDKEKKDKADLEKYNFLKSTM